MSDSLFISLSYFSGKGRSLNTLPTSRERNSDLLVLVASLQGSPGGGLLTSGSEDVPHEFSRHDAPGDIGVYCRAVLKDHQSIRRTGSNYRRPGGLRMHVLVPDLDANKESQGEKEKRDRQIHEPFQGRVLHEGMSEGRWGAILAGPGHSPYRARRDGERVKAQGAQGALCRRICRR
jgi:hypothetical protein